MTNNVPRLFPETFFCSQRKFVNMPVTVEMKLKV